jgi:hypothetical protein
MGIAGKYGLTLTLRQGCSMAVMNLSTQSSARAPAPAAVSVTGLGKAFGGTAVLDGIDLDVPAGRSSRCSAERGGQARN